MVYGPYTNPRFGLLCVWSSRSAWPCLRFVRAVPGLYWYEGGGCGRFFSFRKLYSREGSPTLIPGEYAAVHYRCTSDEAGRLAALLKLLLVFVDAYSGRILERIRW